MPAHAIQQGFQVFWLAGERAAYSGGAAPVLHRIALKTPSLYAVFMEVHCTS